MAKGRRTTGRGGGVAWVPGTELTWTPPAIPAAAGNVFAGANAGAGPASWVQTPAPVMYGGGQTPMAYNPAGYYQPQPGSRPVTYRPSPLVSGYVPATGRTMTPAFNEPSPNFGGGNAGGGNGEPGSAAFAQMAQYGIRRNWQHTVGGGPGMTGIDYGLSRENIERQGGAFNEYGSPLGTPAPFNKAGARHAGARSARKLTQGELIKRGLQQSSNPSGGGYSNWENDLVNWNI